MVTGKFIISEMDKMLLYKWRVKVESQKKKIKKNYIHMKKIL